MIVSNQYNSEDFKQIFDNKYSIMNTVMSSNNSSIAGRQMS